MIEVTLDDLGVGERAITRLDAERVARVCAVLDSTVPASNGAALPSLWHWVFFAPVVATSTLGTDGHPKIVAEALTGYPRRMWGAGRVEWLDHLRIGEVAHRSSRLLGAKQSSGRSGPLVVIELGHEINQGDRLCIRERQTLLYRPAGGALTLPADVPVTGPTSGGAGELWVPDERLLFRFSAVTFNSHRIHYDAPYASKEEGYPRPVVHGPLSAIRLAGFIEHTVGASLRTFEFTATAPLFVGCRAELVVDAIDTDAVGTARVLRNDGTLAMRASFELSER